MAVWKMLQTQPSLANSFRITRIYSTQCTTIQPWQSGWVWGMLELLGKMICKQLFSLKGIFSNKNARIQYFQIPFKQNEMTCFKNSLIVSACWTVFHSLSRTKGTSCKAVAAGLTSVFPLQDKEHLFQKLKERPGRRTQRVLCLFYSSSILMARNLILRNSVHIIYDLCALCKVMFPLTPCRVSTPIYRDRGWTKLLLKNQSLTSLRKRRKRCRPTLLSSNQLTDHHAHLR